MKTQTQRKLTIGTIAAVITTIMFATGIESVPDLVSRFRSKLPAFQLPKALRSTREFDALLERLSPEVREGVTEYLQTLEDFEDGTGSVERLWLAIPNLANALIHRDHGRQFTRLSEYDFIMLQKKLRGVFLYRFETLHCDPDSLFFLEASRRNGTAADTGFFECYRQTHPRGKWPIFIQPQTDLTGCIDYGSGKLVELYEQWHSFKVSYPSDYVVPVKEILDNITELLAKGTCACGSRETVEHEFQSFVNRFPRHALSIALNNRIMKLRTGVTDIRFSCHSG
jgi:hypothetical protein